MTNRRLPSKITAPTQKKGPKLWIILGVFITLVVAGWGAYIRLGPSTISESKITPTNILTPGTQEAQDADDLNGEDLDVELPTYDFDSLEDMNEDVITTEDVHESELVRIYKQQQSATHGQANSQPKWLQNAVSWPYKLNQPMVAIVINDVEKLTQKEWAVLRKYKIPLSYTISVDDKNYKKLANLAHKKGREVIAHVPMEPLHPTKLPVSLRNKNWISAKASKAEIQKRIKEVIDETPFVVGLSNQMGSAFTSHDPAMRHTLSFLKQLGYIFLDSMTTKDSQGLTIAKDLRSPYLRRHLSFSFKANQQDFSKLADQALNHNAYLIVFVSPELKSLMETLQWIERKQTEGTVFVPLTAIMRRSMVQQKLPLNIDKKSKVFFKSPGMV